MTLGHNIASRKFIPIQLHMNENCLFIYWCTVDIGVQTFKSEKLALSPIKAKRNVSKNIAPNCGYLQYQFNKYTEKHVLLQQKASIPCATNHNKTNSNNT